MVGVGWLLALSGDACNRLNSNCDSFLSVVNILLNFVW